MYFIYYELKDGKNEFKEFETEDEAIQFFWGSNIKSYRIISGKEYKFVLVESETLGHQEVIKKEPEEECSECDNKIAKWNKSGLCKTCKDAKITKEKRRKQREKRKHREHRKTKQVEDSIEEEPVEEKAPEEKEIKMGKCRKCTKEFELENWQHSTMHWCSECRKSPDYKDYSE